MFKIKTCAKGVVLLSSSILLASPGYSAEDGDGLEEVVVTGSYIRRSAEDSPSPLSVIDKAELDAIGASDMKDVVSNLTFNSGSLGGSASAFYGGDNSTGNANVNLRNLGNGATLVLINGKRTVTTSYDNVGSGYVDLQSLIPNIALERVEVVKDGSSALYGSDAVAGVVNFITRGDFEGVELQASYGVDDESGEQEDTMISFIMGAGGDMGHVTFSASYLDRSPLQIGDRYDDYGRTGLSTFGQPGRYVPLGGITAAPSFFVPAGSTAFGGRADPDCDLVAADDGPMGVLGTSGADLCIYDFSSFFNLVMDETQAKAHVDASINVSDDLEVYGSLSMSDNKASRGNSLYPDVNFAVIPASHFGLQLDAARRGVAPVPYLALQRMIGGHYESSFEDRPLDTDSVYERSVYRMNLGTKFDFEMGSNVWSADMSMTFSQYEIHSINPSDTLTDNVNAAYVGLGGPNCDQINGTAGSGNLGTGDCFYYNNFQTSVFDPVTGQRWNTSDNSPWAADPTLTVAQAALRYQNPQELLQWMQGEIATDTETEQLVLDFVVAGDVFETSAGTAGLAIGAQYRHDEATSDIDTNSNNNNFKFIFGAQDWSNDETAYSVFSELYVPLTDWAELTVAGRYESFDELDTSTFDPKVTLMLTPTETLTIRASAGTSFRTPSLLQSGGRSTSLLNSTDAFSGTGGLAFRPTLTSGNPNLDPEESTAWNIGFSWIPEGNLEGLSLNVDYYSYEYDDLISREGHQDLINQDNALRCPDGVNTDPTAGPLCGTSDQDGDGINEVYSLGAGIPNKVIRAADGSLLRTQASYFNAPSLETSGIDMTLGYNWDTSAMGQFSARLNVSYTLEYDIVTGLGAEIDGVGSRNAGNSIGHPLPEYKANLVLGWTHERHNATLITRHIDGYEDDVPQSALRGSFFGFAPNIDSMTTVDLQYNYALPEIGLVADGSILTFGVKNLSNETPPKVNVDGGFDPFTHDPRGRIYYGRVTIGL